MAASLELVAISQDGPTVTDGGPSVRLTRHRRPGPEAVGTLGSFTLVAPAGSPSRVPASCRPRVR